MPQSKRSGELDFQFEMKDLEVLSEALWHALQRADVPDDELERMRLLREKFTAKLR